MNHLNLNLNTLAKSHKWQSLMALSKDFNGFNLFNNSTNFTAIQLEFIGWLIFYHNANMEIELGNLPEFAYAKDIYIEAYNRYKSVEGKKKIKNAGASLPSKDSKKQNSITGLKVLFE